MQQKYWTALVVCLLLLYVAYTNWPRGGNMVKDVTIEVPQRNEQIETMQEKAKKQTTVVIKPSGSIDAAIREWAND